MRRLLLIMTFLAAAPAGAAKYTYSEEAPPEIENYNSNRMEAKAILGELKYQHGDLSGADATFKESINASTRLDTPQSHVMALDLYRTAELAVRKKDFAGARKHLEILLSRYPDSDWADKAERLLEALSQGKSAGGADEEASAPILSGPSPESQLRRIQDALRSGRSEDALADCEDFLRRSPAHAAVAELKLLQGTLLLALKEPISAAQVLKALLAVTKDPILRNKAVYLLGAALLDAGRLQAVLDNVPSASPAKTWDRWLALAQTWRAAALERLGRGEEAAKLYQELAASAPSSPLKSYILAANAVRQDKLGRYEKAAELMRETAAEGMHWGQTDLRASAQLAEAHVLYRQNKLADAADAYGAFALKNAAHPQATLALYQQGLTLKRLDRRPEAIKAFEALVRLHPESVFAQDAHLQLGQLYAALGRTSEAVAHYRKLGDENETLLLTAQIHYNDKRYKDAIPLYWEYLKKAPDGARAKEVADLLLTSYWQGDRDNPEMARAVSLYPHHPIAGQIRWGLGAKAYQDGDYKAAEESFRRLTLDFPKNSHRAEVLFFSGECLMKLSEFRAAAQSYAALLKSFPKDPNARQARFRLATAQLETRDYALAAQSYGLVTGKDVMAADAMLNRALALAKSGKKAGVLAAYEQFLTKFPLHSKAGQVYFEVAELRQAQGHLAAAVKAYEKAGGARRAQALFNIARIQERLKKHALALKAYASLQAASPKDDPFRLSGLVRLALMSELKDPVKAMQLYAEVLKHAPRASPSFDTARKRLQALSAEGALVKH